MRKLGNLGLRAAIMSLLMLALLLGIWQLATQPSGGGPHVASPLIDVLRSYIGGG